ncbi:hypothetical protein OS493_012476 [Desmophyllum pertusum]|uniref:Uncharacterized protein n=1 Tax=Desmophyllum pertusum TaxID=174260 RepID=A0A9W9ZQX2_9CNID|nr:hypothetical protein OS493_012476 [Desmophyllum pertusum]
MQRIDARPVQKINELVKESVTSVAEMERHLHYYVKKELFSGMPVPNPANRRFVPSRHDIYNFMVTCTEIGVASDVSMLTDEEDAMQTSLISQAINKVNPLYASISGHPFESEEIDESFDRWVFQYYFVVRCHSKK